MRRPAIWKLVCVAWLSLLAIGGVTAGCIIGGDKCDAHQVHHSGNYDICVCEPNAVLNASGVGCTPCGEQEEIVSGACSCKAGFVKGADGTCMASEIGASCTAAAACMTAAFPYCALGKDPTGYCTSQGCSVNADCPAGWSCEAAAGTHYCHRPPTGLGTACKSSDDCSAFDASYCETLQSHTCILQGCAVSTVACPNEWGCCDFSALLGAPLSVCYAPAMLVAGACPSGGRLVAP